MVNMHLFGRAISMKLTALIETYVEYKQKLRDKMLQENIF
jgi:hypothetical protein